MSKQLLTDIVPNSDSISFPDNLPNLIHTDSRSIQAGQWFVPIVGGNFDGHSYIKDAIQKGAIGFFYQKEKAHIIPTELLTMGYPVDDTTATLQQIARKWRLSQPNLKVVGITGSSGKTTLKELSALVLSKFGPTLKTEGSLNNELGVPLTLCQLRANHKFGVIEMGARHIGDIKFLSEIVEQDIGVLANVGTAHVGEFGGTENILRAKMEIAHAPICIYFRDDLRIHSSMLDLKNKRLIAFGEHPESHVRLLEQKPLPSGGVTLKVSVGTEVFTQDFPYFHESFPINVACCLAIAHGLEINPAEALQCMVGFSGLKGRFQIHQIDKLTLIDDAYNANPHSMKAGLETLNQAYAQKRKTIILGDMNELGDSSEDAHRSIGELCAEFFPSDQLITVGQQAEWIAQGAIDKGLRAQQVLRYKDVDSLLPKLADQIKGSELLYVKASNSLKLNKIIDTLLLR